MMIAESDVDLATADRRALDELVFDAVGLTTGERDAVLEAVVQLVCKRLDKAKGL